MGTNVEWRDRVQSLAAQVERIIRFTGLSNRAVVWECDARTVVLELPEVFRHAKFDGWSMGRNQPIHQLQNMTASYAQRTFDWCAAKGSSEPLLCVR